MTNTTPPRHLRPFVVAALLALVACGAEEPRNERGVLVYGVPADRPVETAAVQVGEATAVRPGAGTPTTTPAPAPAAGNRPAPRRAGAYTVIEVTDGGTIRGTVKLDRAADRPMIPITKDVELCGHPEHPTQRIVFDPDTLGLANCVVYLADISKGKDWTGEFAKEDDERQALIDQHLCQYEPHVQVVRQDTQLAVKNSDGAAHNIHGYLNNVLTTIFNFGSAAHSVIEDAGPAFLERDGKVILKCDIHPWMNAYVFVVKHPYHVVTDTKGSFELTGVPPGEYTLVCWHEGFQETPVIQDGAISGYQYGEPVEQQQKVTVAAGGTVEADFVVPAP